MLDHIIRPYIDPPLNAAGRLMEQKGISANTVTLAGFGVAGIVFVLLAFQQYFAAALFICVNRLMDGLDGPVARAHGGGTDLGGFLDIVTDFIFYAGVPFFFALGRPEQALPAAFLIFSFIGSASTFLAYAVIAVKRGEETEMRGAKSFYHLGGLAEGTETIAALLLICLFPAAFSWIAVLFGLVCWLTAFGRAREAWLTFGDGA